MTGSEYLRSLDPERRPVVREWMELPDEEFKARMAVALMDINERLASVSRPPWKGFPHAFGGAVGGFIAAFFGFKGMNG